MVSFGEVGEVLVVCHLDSLSEGRRTLSNTTFPAAATVWPAVALVTAVLAIASVATTATTTLGLVCGRAIKVKQ